MATVADATRAEQSRARYPDEDGFVERDGVRVFYELYGEGEPTVLFLPTWSIIHSRGWKVQIPYFARHCPRGHLRRAGQWTLRPSVGARGLRGDGVRRRRAGGDGRHRDGPAVIVSLSRGAERSLLLGADHPDRVAAMVFIAPAAAPSTGLAARARSRHS